jgi:hypothetical protein
VITAPCFSRYTRPRHLRGGRAPAGHSKPDRCEISGQRPPDDATTRTMASNSSFRGLEKAEAPVSCSQPGPRVSAWRRAASCRSPFARRASSNHPGDVRRRTRTR